MAEPIYEDNGRISIWEVDNPKRSSCTYEVKEGRTCKRNPRELFLVERYNSVLAATVCHTHRAIVIKAAKKDAHARKKNLTAEPESVNEILGILELTDFFDPPAISRVRFLDRVDFKGESLDDLVKETTKLERHQYLVVSQDFQIVPGNVSNFRKKGLFLDIPMIRGKSLRHAAHLAIEQMDEGVIYAGMRHMDNTDNARREYSLVTLIEGTMIQNLLGDPGRRRGLRFFGADGNRRRIDLDKNDSYSGSGIFLLYVPSSSNADMDYRVVLKELRTKGNGTKRYRGRYGIDYECACEASVRDELTTSDVNSGGRPYANGKVRPCKHAYAALAYLEEHKHTLPSEPRTPVKPSRFARKLNSRLRTRVLHGNKHLRREEQEVILMRAIAPNVLGYDQMFDKSR